MTDLDDRYRTPTKRRFPHTIAGRLDDDLMQTALALKESMPGNSWAEMLRWLLSSEEIRPIIAEKVRNGHGPDE